MYSIPHMYSNIKGGVLCIHFRICNIIWREVSVYSLPHMYYNMAGGVVCIHFCICIIIWREVLCVFTSAYVL